MGNLARRQISDRETGQQISMPCGKYKYKVEPSIILSLLFYIVASRDPVLDAVFNAKYI